MMANLIKTNWNALLSIFFPLRCIGCEFVLDSKALLCAKCQFDLDFTNQILGTDNDSYAQIAELCQVENAYSLLNFSRGNLTQKLLHSLKYRGQQKIGVFMADLVFEDCLKNETILFDGIIPVPIHPKKERKRGYNQVYSFAKRLSEHAEVPFLKGVLIRTKNNQSQTFKNRTERLKALKNSFQVKNFTNLNGKHILLVDDVLTTGATISTCVNVLKSEIRNLKVSIVTIAFANS